jgi:predicted enzyme related to lactoylglutathione lyase
MATTKTLTKKNKKSAAAAKKANVAKKAKKANVARSAKKAPKGAITGAARMILYVSDFDRALSFYTETLGLELAYPAGGGWGELKTGQASICIHSGREGTLTTKGITSVGFAVDDFDAAFAKLKERGVVLSKPFAPCGDLRVSSFCDPDGNELSIEGK